MMAPQLWMWRAVIARLDQASRDGRILYGQEVDESRAIPSRELPLPLVWSGRRVGVVCSLFPAEYGRSIGASGFIDLARLNVDERAGLCQGGDVDAVVHVDVAGEDIHEFGPGGMLYKNWQVRMVTVEPGRGAWSPRTVLKLDTDPYADLSKWNEL